MIELSEKPRSGRKPPGKNAAKWNWPPILEAVDSGIPLLEVAKRFSVPIGSLRCKVGEVRKRLAAEARKVVFQETGLPAPLPSNTQLVTSKNEISAPEADSPSPAELTNAQLVALLSDHDTFLALKPEDAEKAIGKRVQGMLAQALANPPEARTLKDVATLHKIFRDANGLTAKEGKGGNGLLSPPRAFGRRAVAVPVDVIEVEPADSWDDMGEI